jgi:hypothetical protein
MASKSIGAGPTIKKAKVRAMNSSKEPKISTQANLKRASLPHKQKTKPGLMKAGKKKFVP